MEPANSFTHFLTKAINWSFPSNQPSFQLCFIIKRDVQMQKNNHKISHRERGKIHFCWPWFSDRFHATENHLSLAVFEGSFGPQSSERFVLSEHKKIHSEILIQVCCKLVPDLFLCLFLTLFLLPFTPKYKNKHDEMWDVACCRCVCYCTNGSKSLKDVSHYLHFKPADGTESSQAFWEGASEACQSVTADTRVRLSF